MKTIYSDEAVYLGYEVKNGRLQIESELYGDYGS